MSEYNYSEVTNDWADDNQICKVYSRPRTREVPSDDIGCIAMAEGIHLVVEVKIVGDVGCNEGPLWY